MRLVLFALLFTTTVLSAQQAKEKAGRMIFSPGATEPVISGTAATQPVDQPSENIEQFFLALKADQVDAAYNGLVKGTIIAARADDVASLKTRTNAALEAYGPVTGYEVVDEQVVGSNLLRRTCVSLNTDLPLRWRFYFYKSGRTWRLVDLRVDDALVELFEESGRAKK